MHFFFCILFLVSAPAFAIVIPVTPSGQDPTAFANSFLAPPGTIVDVNGAIMNLNGVVKVSQGSAGCSGVMVSATQILTAAHCLPSTYDVLVTFATPSNGANVITASSYVIDPAYNSSDFTADLAIVTIPNAAPAEATIYSLFSGSYSFESTVTMAGYGYTGDGATGYYDGNYGTLRVGENVYDTTGSGSLSPDLYLGDFDNGTSTNNALGGTDSAIINDEVTLAPGDSGGPTFYNGQIIGIHDIIGCIPDSVNPANCAVPPSVNINLASYYGQLFGDTSVQANSAWISQQLAIGAAPEPSSWIYFIVPVPAALILRRRKATLKA